MVLKIIGVILGLIAVIEIAWLIKLLTEEKETEANANKVFVRIPGIDKEYALTERTIQELQDAGVSIIVEQH